MKPNQHEATGPHFSLSKFLQARERAWCVLHDIAAQFEEGMHEATAQEIIKSSFRKDKPFWHPLKVRFGANTTCSFKDNSFSHEPLHKGSPFFLDLGPIYDDHEADVGQSFILGDDSFCNPAEVVFKACEQQWLKSKLTGKELYKFAEKKAQELGFSLNPKMAGHRLSDFPHSLVSKEKLSSLPYAPKAQLWILEIHLINKERNCGYFYEDLLGVAKATPPR